MVRLSHAFLSALADLDHVFEIHNAYVAWHAMHQAQCYCAEVLYPPACEKRQHQLPGPDGSDDIRQDQYYWLRDDDRTDEDVLAHLRVLSHLHPAAYVLGCMLALCLNEFTPRTRMLLREIL